MRALILAGGFGTRLRSVVSDRPKPMALIAGRPLLEYQVCWLKNAGITDIVLCTGYLYEQVERHFGDGKPWGVAITYSVEPEPLGTAGALKYAAQFVDKTVLCLNGDGLVRVDFGLLLQSHRDKMATVTMACCEIMDTSRYGLVLTDEGGRITGFREKSSAAGPGYVNAGIYVLEPSVFQTIPVGRSVSIEQEIFPNLVEQKGACYSYTYGVEFLDIGTPEGYEQAQWEIYRFMNEKDGNI